MSERLLNNLEFLNKLAEFKGKQQTKIILDASEENIRALTELVYNLLDGNIDISQETKQNLKKHKIFLRSLSNKNTSVDKKKKSLLRKRSCLGVIFAPILSIVGSCLGKVVADSIV